MKKCLHSLRFNETNYELISFPHLWCAYESVHHTGAMGPDLLLVSGQGNYTIHCQITIEIFYLYTNPSYLNYSSR